MVVIAYLGWAAYGATVILLPDHPPSFSRTISGVALAALGISWTLFAVQKYPLSFYLYVVFPCYFWREALVTSSGPLLQLYRSGKLQGSMKLLLYAVFVVAALQCMVVGVSIFAYTEGVTSNLRLTFTNRLDTLIGASGAPVSSPSESCGPPGDGRTRF